MTTEDKAQLITEINHIFDSGANTARIFEMVKSFIDKINGVNKVASNPLNIEKLKRRLMRFTIQKDAIEPDHKGKESQYTYHGGFSLGYLKGKISEIERVIDEIETVD